MEELIVWLMVIVGYDPTIENHINRLSDRTHQVRVHAHKSLRQADLRSLPLCELVVRTGTFPAETTRRCECLLRDIYERPIRDREMPAFGRMTKAKFTYDDNDPIVSHYLDRVITKHQFDFIEFEVRRNHEEQKDFLVAPVYREATKLAIRDRLLLGQSRQSIGEWLDKLKGEEASYIFQNPSPDHGP